jgi:hypothetical protein
MKFEKIFDKPPGHRPESYWQPWLGDHCGIRPPDVADLTARQLMDCYEYAMRTD